MVSVSEGVVGYELDSSVGRAAVLHTEVVGSSPTQDSMVGKHGARRAHNPFVGGSLLPLPLLISLV